MNNQEWKALSDRVNDHDSAGNIERDFSAFLRLQEGEAADKKVKFWSGRWFNYLLLMVVGAALGLYLLWPAGAVSTVTESTHTSTVVTPIPTENGASLSESSTTNNGYFFGSRKASITATENQSDIASVQKSTGASTKLPIARSNQTPNKVSDEQIKRTLPTTVNPQLNKTGLSDQPNQEANQNYAPESAISETYNSAKGNTESSGSDIAPTEANFNSSSASDALQFNPDRQKAYVADSIAALPTVDLRLSDPKIPVDVGLEKFRKSPSRWQPYLEGGVAFRPSTGFLPSHTYGTYYGRVGLGYQLVPRLRVGIALGYQDMRRIAPRINETPFTGVTFIGQVRDPVRGTEFDIIRVLYATSKERAFYLNAEVAYRVLPKLYAEAGGGIGRLYYEQEATFSDNIPADDPLRTDSNFPILRRYTPTGHITARYQVLPWASVVMRANLAFRDLSPDAIHPFEESHTATGYQVGIRVGL